MAHPLSSWFALLRAGLAVVVIWPVALALVDAIRSGQIQGAPGFVIRRAEQLGRFWFLVFGLVLLKGIAAAGGAYFVWLAIRAWR